MDTRRSCNNGVEVIAEFVKFRPKGKLVPLLHDEEVGHSPRWNSLF